MNRARYRGNLLSMVYGDQTATLSGYGAVLLACLALVQGACVSTGPVSSRSAVSPAAASERSERQILVTLVQKTPAPLPRAGSTPKPYGGVSRYQATARSRRTAARLAREYGLREVDEWPIQALGVHCVVFEIPEGASAQEILVRLSEDPRVESAQSMQMFEVLAEESYNDPYLRLQHGVESMQIREAHRWAMGKGVTVAVIDTGVDLHHPELEGRISAARDFVSDRRRNPTADLHGTAVAGVIASAANNGIGIVGVAPSVRIMALKACWESQQASESAKCNSFTLAKAIAFAVDKAPDVVNLSLTGPPDPLLERLVRAALDRGIVVVAASEDSGDEPHFPSSVEGVIAVCATVDEGKRQGVAGKSRGDPRLLAPGNEILTTTPSGSYDFVSGSSFAAAHVSGIAALLRELEPKLGARPLRRLLLDASTTAQQPGLEGVEVNACAALAQLVPAADCMEAGAGG